MKITSDIFPCGQFPKDAGIARLLGLYPQIQEGLWMQRIKIPGGHLTGGQWNALGDIVREFTPQTPLRLTTRQDVEIHDLLPGQVPLVQRKLSESDMTSLGACGDTLRNITVCPCSGVATGTVNLMPLARQLRTVLEGMDVIYSLARKLKISLSCSDHCGQPWINDLGLVARKKDNRWGFRLIGAGSLGARSATGITIFNWLEVEDVLPLAVAAVRVFYEHGDRQNRHQARLRHVRERLGDTEFIKLINDVFSEVKMEEQWPEVSLEETEDGFSVSEILTFTNGEITAAMAEALGQLAADTNYRVRISNQHKIIVFGKSATLLRQKLDGFSVLSKAAQIQPSIVACPGTKWCSRGLVNTNDLADRIREELGHKLSADTTVCISGCPNGCSHARVADIGLVGCVSRKNGQREGLFNMYTGGNMGRDDRLAEPAAKKLAVEQVINTIGESI